MSDLLTAAQGYRQRGWQPVPIPHRAKGPILKGWQKLRLAENELAKHFTNGHQNLGIILGEPSKGLIDIDLDSPEALLLASSVLPKTSSVFGRPGKLRSHRLYTCDPIPRTEKFLDPRLERSKDGDERKHATLVEIRSTGGQTVFPPSTHPSGETIDWESDAQPTPIDGAELRRAVARLAALALLARSWPGPGARHDAALALAGGLAAAGWPPRDVEDCVELVSRTAGDPEVYDRRRAAESTQQRLQSGGPASGWPTLARLIGTDVVDRVRNWLGIRMYPTPVEQARASEGQEQEGEKPRTKSGQKTPTIYTAAELIGMKFPEPRWAVPGMIAQGLWILGGKPKMGKSFMVLGLGLAIANGGHALGKVPVQPGEVLYLAMEDTWESVQERLVMLTGESNPPAGLQIATEWPRMGKGGGLRLLTEYVAEHPNIKLLIIDTLAKIRERTMQTRSANLYEIDYAAGEVLKQLADRNNLSVLVLHHLRKAPGDDPMDTFSGTLGLTGAADGLLVLARDRGRADAVLHITGRRVREQELALKWDETTAQWTLLGDAEDYRKSKERNEIVQVLQRTGWPMSPKEIAEALGKKPATIRWLIWKMTQDGSLKSIDGKYAVANVGSSVQMHQQRKRTNAANALTTDGTPSEPIIMSNTTLWQDSDGLGVSKAFAQPPTPQTLGVSAVGGVCAVGGVGGVCANAQNSCVGCGALLVDGVGRYCQSCVEYFQALQESEPDYVEGEEG